MDPDSTESLVPYPDPDSQSGSGPRRAKMTHENLKSKEFHHLRAEPLKASPVAWTSFMEA